jgi:hypothetical protein
LPGYLSMGWRRLGRLRIALRPSGVTTVPRLAAARVPADLWSLPTSAGEDVGSVLSDSQVLADLLSTQPPVAGVQTARSVPYFQWRYGTCPVGYRALLAGSSLRDGVVFFRLRRRGPATEVVIADTLVPGGNPRLAAALARRVLEDGGGDYAIVLSSAWPRGWFPLPRRMGPLLTWRPLADEGAPPIGRWQLRAGDVELF